MSVSWWRSFFSTSVNSGVQLLSICPLFEPLFDSSPGSLTSPRHHVTHHIQRRRMGLETRLEPLLLVRFFSPTILIYFRDTFTYERRRQVSREREKGTEGRWRTYFWLYVCPTAFVLWRNVLTRLRNRDGGTAKLLLPRQSLTACQMMRSMPLRLYIPRGKEISERGDSYVDSMAKGARDTGTGTCCLLIAFFDTLY